MSALSGSVFYGAVADLNGHRERGSGLAGFTPVIDVVMIQPLNDGSGRKSVPPGQTGAD